MCALIHFLWLLRVQKEWYFIGCKGDANQKNGEMLCANNQRKINAPNGSGKRNALNDCSHIRLSVDSFASPMASVALEPWARRLDKFYGRTKNNEPSVDSPIRFSRILLDELRGDGFYLSNAFPIQFTTWPFSLRKKFQNCFEMLSLPHNEI